MLLQNHSTSLKVRKLTLTYFCYLILQSSSLLWSYLLSFLGWGQILSLSLTFMTLAFILWNIFQLSFVWHFSMIRLRLCIFGRNVAETVTGTLNPCRAVPLFPSHSAWARLTPPCCHLTDLCCHPTLSHCASPPPNPHWASMGLYSSLSHLLALGLNCSGRKEKRERNSGQVFL